MIEILFILGIILSLFSGIMSLYLFFKFRFQTQIIHDLVFEYLRYDKVVKRNKSKEFSRDDTMGRI